MKKKILALILTSAMVLSLAACGKTDSTPAADDSTATEDQTAEETPAEVEDVALKVWVPENQIQSGTIDSMCESFQAAHPEWNITFTVEAQGEDTAKDEILKDVTATADVYFFASDQLPELVDAGAIAKLGGSTEEMVKTTMPQAVVDTVTYNDSIYAIPFTHNTFFMFYDKTILSDEDVKTMEGIMAKETADDVYNFSFDSAGGWKLGSWYYGAGNTIYGADSVSFAEGCDWNNETGLAVTNYLIDLINNTKCAYQDDISVSELVGDHRLGAWWDGSWNYNLYSEALGDDLGMTILPTFNLDGNDYQLKGFYSSKCIGVNPQSAYPQVAVAFAAYLGSEEMQLQRFEETAQVPTNTAAGESEAVKNDALSAVIIREAAEASVAQPQSSEFGSRYWGNVGGFATEIRSGEFTKENAQEKLDTFCAAMVVE